MSIQKLDKDNLSEDEIYVLEQHYRDINNQIKQTKIELMICDGVIKEFKEGKIPDGSCANKEHFQFKHNKFISTLGNLQLEANLAADIITKHGGEPGKISRRVKSLSALKFLED